MKKMDTVIGLSTDPRRSHKSSASLKTLPSSRSWKTKPCVHHHGYSDDWPELRMAMGKFFSSKVFDYTLACCLAANLVLLVLETDYHADVNADVPTWIRAVNFILIAVYFLELVCRIFVYRKDFFVSFHNWADMCIICVDVTVEILILIIGDRSGWPSIVFLRIFRLVRLGRTHRALVMFPELNILVLGLAGALKAIFWGMILLTIVLIAWGILAVQIIHPLNVEVADAGAYEKAGSLCERCPRSFESVGSAVVTFTQHIIAGDSWGQVIPIIEYRPWTFVFFFAVLSTLGMTVLNLILAVVIDSAVGARKETDHQMAIVKEQEFVAASKRLSRLCKDLDSNRDGAINLPELRNGCLNNAEFADTMRAMDLRPTDMETIFKILDVEQSGEVPYDEFVDELYKLKTYEPHTLLVFTKFYCTEIHRILVKEMQMLRESLNVMHTIEETEFKRQESETEVAEKVRQSSGGISQGDVLLQVSPKDNELATSSVVESKRGNDAQSSVPIALDVAELIARGSTYQAKAVSQSYDLSFVRESTDQILSLLREVASDVRMNGRILGSLDDTCILKASLLGKQVEHSAPSSNAVSHGQQILDGTARASAIGTRSGGSWNLMSLTSQRSAKGFMPTCCQNDATTSLPPVSYI